jgi:fluoride ion exporter CrcB/FEX
MDEQKIGRLGASMAEIFTPKPAKDPVSFGIVTSVSDRMLSVSVAGAIIPAVKCCQAAVGDEVVLIRSGTQMIATGVVGAGVAIPRTEELYAAQMPALSSGQIAPWSSCFRVGRIVVLAMTITGLELGAESSTLLTSEWPARFAVHGETALTAFSSWSYDGINLLFSGHSLYIRTQYAASDGTLIIAGAYPAAVE